LKSVYDTFVERGFIEQVTDGKLVRKLLRENQVACYVGFDPTATSLHIGSLVPIMALMYMRRYGHRTIALIGGGTGLIGDPSGKTQMRQVLSQEQIQYNVQCLKKQLSNYLELGDGRTILLDNADWLGDLKYIEFLRDIGRYFSVNKMLTAESYRLRLEKGLNFVEFNYMLLQAYDFLYLFKNHDCVLQMGGNDQWGNMLAGADLIRRVEGKMAYSMTFPLITTSLGHKMGKTEKGTIWLDPVLTSPYEYYQYWANTDDHDVERFLAFFTFLPMEEVRQVKSLTDARLNMAKAVLAFEATKIAHGEKAALAAWKASIEAFHVKPVDADIFPSSTIPRIREAGDISAIPFLEKSRLELEKGVPAFKLFHETHLCGSQSEARRLLSQGGGYVNNRQIETFDKKIGLEHVNDHSEILLRKGKKNYFIVKVK
jgi:tyrosyl-tRNA synthetase